MHQTHLSELLHTNFVRQLPTLFPVRDGMIRLTVRLEIFVPGNLKKLLVLMYNWNGATKQAVVCDEINNTPKKCVNYFRFS